MLTNPMTNEMKAKIKAFAIELVKEAFTNNEHVESLIVEIEREGPMASTVIIMSAAILNSALNTENRTAQDQLLNEIVTDYGIAMAQNKVKICIAMAEIVHAMANGGSVIMGRLGAPESAFTPPTDKVM